LWRALRAGDSPGSIPPPASSGEIFPRLLLSRRAALGRTGRISTRCSRTENSRRGARTVSRGGRDRRVAVLESSMAEQSWRSVALDGEVEFALRELLVSEREIFSEVFAPGLDGFEENVVNVRRVALGFDGFGELVERAFENGVAGEDANN